MSFGVQVDSRAAQSGMDDRVRRKLTTRPFISSLTVFLCSYPSKVPRGSSNRASTRSRTSLNVHSLADTLSSLTAAQTYTGQELTQTPLSPIVLARSCPWYQGSGQDLIRPYLCVASRAGECEDVECGPSTDAEAQEGLRKS